LFETDDDAPVMQNAAASRTEEPHVRAEASEQGAAILKLLEALPAPQREAFLLYEEGGLSVEEIAGATGVTFEAAKSRLRYAVAKLREGLQEYA
jgi:RNA polymerase sigma factor (sigma-70 family)